MMARPSVALLTMVAALALAGVSGCASSTSPSGPVPFVHLSSPPLVSFPSLSFSRLVAAGQRVMTTQSEWAAFWSQALADFTPSPPLPAVDFSQDVVLLTSMGIEPTGGYATGIVRADQTADGHLVVAVNEVAPGNCGTTLAVTYPADAVTVPRSAAKSVEFQVSRMVRVCGQ